jgi:hypothetical protein
LPHGRGLLEKGTAEKVVVCKTLAELEPHLSGAAALLDHHRIIEPF